MIDEDPTDYGLPPVQPDPSPIGRDFILLIFQIMLTLIPVLYPIFYP